MGIWTFFQNQILGMQWLNAVIGALLEALGLDVTGRVGGSVQFFLYDVVKITFLQTVWLFIQDQVLGMQWLNALIGRGLTALGLDTASRWGGSAQFFLYDVIKITVLLCTLIFVISYIQSYFPPERSRRILGRFRGLWANAVSALLGTVTPFCSCSFFSFSFSEKEVMASAS